MGIAIRFRQLILARIHYSLLLAEFYFAAGHKEKACAVLKTTLPLPIGDISDAMYTIDQPLGMMADRGPWKAAVMAYRAGRYDIALAVCDRWESYCNSEIGLRDRSYHTIRAAIYPAHGEFDRALPETEEMIRLRQQGRHFGDDVDELKRAIERHDRTFVYKTHEGPVNLFVEYE